MKTDEDYRVAKIVEKEILDNLKIEATQQYDGWNGTVVEVKLFYKDDLVTETKFNVL
jgi:hypothetical protein